MVAGQDVRALTTRDLSTVGLPARVQLVRGDLTQPETLVAALKGVDRVFLVPIASAMGDFVDLAQKAGVRRVVVLSTEVAARPKDFAAGGVEHHRAIEQAVERGNFEWTILRPTGFAANTLEWASSIAEEGVVRTTYPNAAQALIHEADIAAVAVKALTEDGHEGQRYVLTGPEAITKIKQVTAIGKAIGRDIRFEEVSPVHWRASMAQHVSELVIDMMMGHSWDASAEPGTVDPTVARILGRPARTFDQWAADHQDDFTQPS
nr:Oxidoreductase [Kibdelosporangium sp. MJ126-NF4]